ncbi:response regulator transcription factor [Micrococcus sp.]|uniref:response regulator transcription factor n=1 Tax=Micrococcus sp. TaxID=1271 RepID=UPI002A90C3F6|nr:response regulator transcription factor [Micrococcus sp.]MDY6055260.1 response regulator transcription factor [Micrococcus sp.]
MTGTRGAAPRVLVVEDEPVLSGTVKTYLERAGMSASTCGDGLSALERIRTASPDVVVLDLGLPGLDGVEVCRRLRTFSDCYVMMLTARAEEADTLLGLTAGADDYMTKPFSPRELVARIQVLLRRPRTGGTGAPAEEVHRVGGLVLEPSSRRVEVDGAPVELTRTEFDLLQALVEQPGRVLSRRRLIDAVWGEGWGGDDHLVDVHIAHVRRKLGDDPSCPRFVHTVRGVGYRMERPR